ncbi:MAG: hypothetical protein LBG47_10555 [Prevotellaceae bacterium]|nr:hypothetical protein [Prevotellaceae bacterium]
MAYKERKKTKAQKKFTAHQKNCRSQNAVPPDGAPAERIVKNGKRKTFKIGRPYQNKRTTQLRFATLLKKNMLSL